MKKWFIGVVSTLVAVVALMLGALQFGLVPRPLITAVLGLRYPDTNPERIAPSRTLATFTSDTFLEGIAVDRDGSLYVSGMQQDQGYIWHYVDGTVKEVVKRAGFFGTLAFDQHDVLFATLRSGSARDLATQRWQIVTVGDAGSITPIVDFPLGAAPNGISFDNQGNLYAADSVLGYIWRIQQGTTKPEIWLDHVLLKPHSMPGIPGANGIRLWQNSFYVTNSSSGEFVQIPIEADGRAGTPTIIATGVTGDDFAFDANGNSYITTHPYNLLVKVDASGQKITVGNATSDMIGATNAAFGRTATDKDALYIITDGGAFLNLVPYPFNKLFPQDTSLPSILMLQP